MNGFNQSKVCICIIIILFFIIIFCLDYDLWVGIKPIQQADNEFYRKTELKNECQSYLTLSFFHLCGFLKTTIKY